MGQHSDDIWLGTATGPQTAGWVAGGNPGVIGQGVGPMGRTTYLDIVPAALSATAVCAAQAIAGAANATINGASATAGVATFDYVRGVSIVTSNAGNTTQTVTVTGTDYYSQSQTETLTCNGTTTVNGKKAFSTITQVTVSDAITGTISVGNTDVFGLPYRITDAGYLFRTGWAGAVADNAGTFVAADTTSPATATTGDVRGTFTPTTSANGSRRLVIGMIMTSVQSGPNATQTSAIGVTPA